MKKLCQSVRRETVLASTRLSQVCRDKWLNSKDERGRIDSSNIQNGLAGWRKKTRLSGLGMSNWVDGRSSIKIMERRRKRWDLTRQGWGWYRRFHVFTFIHFNLTCFYGQQQSLCPLIFVPNLWVSRPWHHFPYPQHSSGSRDQEVGESMQGDCVNKGDMWTCSWRRPTYKDQHKKEEMEIQGEK